jgi:hypothetical protein
MHFKSCLFSLTIALSVLGVFPNVGLAQDFHLTQADRSMPFLNPAFVGAYKGFERITLLNRNQWIGSGTQFLTTYGMAEFTPGRTRQSERAYAGIGASFSNDVSGTHIVDMIVMDETSAVRLASGSTAPAAITSAFANRFQDVTIFDSDLEAVQAALTDAKVNHLVLSSSVTLRAAKWSQ